MRIIQYLTKITIAIVIGLLIAVAGLAIPLAARAGSPADCQYDGQCVANDTCHEQSPGNFTLTQNDCGSAIIGGVRAPMGVGSYNVQAWIESGGSERQIGILVFASRLLRIFTIVAGLWIFVNIVLSGATFITRAGDAKVFSEVREKLTYSLYGFIILASAYVLAAILGLVFFGNASFIINPDIKSLGALAP